ncbi:MAG TPA: HAMP domain-containing protein, partial [Roseiarcus sp.]|nr:HAMP domain-containing protein [Roseiarcus sp.]
MTPYVHPGFDPDSPFHCRGLAGSRPAAGGRCAHKGIPMFSRLKIASKLLIGFGALLLILVGVSSLSAFSSLQSKNSIEELARHKSNELLDQRFEKRFYQGRMHMWIALGTGDQEHWKQSDEAFKESGERLEALVKDTNDPGRQAKARELARMLQNFKDVTAKYRFFGGQNEALNAPEAKAMVANSLKIGSEIADHANALGSEFESASEKTEAQAKDSAGFIVALAAAVGIASLLLGLILSYVITRSIREPILKLTDVMTSLAKGDLNVSAPNADEPNEIGEMARSVMVFRQNGVERQRLEAEAAAHRAAADAERERTAAERAKAAEEQAEAVRRL